MTASGTASQWNAIVTFKIRDSDLLHPTEKFMIPALLSLLEAMNIKDNWSHLIAQADPHKSQVAKAKFARTVEQVFKIAEPNGTFCYADLVKPEPKKTLRVFQLLLNHLFYYKMMKEEICGDATTVVEEWTRLQTEINAMIVEKEKAKVQEERAQHMMQHHKEEISSMKKRKIELESELATVQTEIQKQKHLAEENRLQHRRITEKLENLKNLVVDDTEATNLETIQRELEAKSAQLTEMQHVQNCRMLENSGTIKEIEETIRRVDSIVSVSGIAVQNVSKISAELSEVYQGIEKSKLKLAEIEAQIKFEHDKNVENNAVARPNQKQLKTRLKGLREKLKMLRDQVKTKESERDRALYELEKSKTALTKAKTEMAQVVQIGTTCSELLLNLLI